ncbi:uncharacterized protein LOC132608052 [Lycium barbarum]|uniref:uncharacterized protein LOC132608052 n=1 Tax=Lycium barbarum TaxID=112863 RepID=UPI00293E1381|nr:uncharacterized protein LOC132608052 [Lycium barbarum]
MKRTRRKIVMFIVSRKVKEVIPMFLRSLVAGDKNADPLSLPYCARTIDVNKFNGMLVHYTVLRHAVHKEKSKMRFLVNDKPVCFDLNEFALITGLNCGSYPSRTREERAVKRGAAFCTKACRDRKICAEKLLAVIRGPRLTKEEKLKCCLVWFMHTIVLAKDVSRGVDHDTIKMADDLEFFSSYPWGTESFELTLDYLKNKIDIPKHHQEHAEKRVASYALYGFPWAFMVWAYEAFPAVGRNARKSEEVPLPIPRILRWHMKKMERFVKGDPFKRAGVIERELEQDYMKNLLPYDDEINDPIIDELERELEGVTVLITPKNSSKASSRKGKKSMEHFDEDYTQEAEDNHSEDLSGNSTAKDNVGVGTSMGHAAPRGQVEHEQMKQCVEKIGESLKVVVAYVEGERIRKSEKAKKKKKKKETLNEVAGEVEVDVDQPIARHVNLPKAQDVHVPIEKESATEVANEKEVPAAEVEIPAAEGEKEKEVPAAEVEVEKEVPSDEANVEFDADKAVSTIVEEINDSIKE